MTSNSYIDIGANLTSPKFDQIGLDNVLKDAKNNKVSSIIITGTSMRGSYEASNLVKDYPGYKLFSTAGVHPHGAKAYNDDTTNKLRNLLKNQHIVAVGECGLDYNRMFSPKEDQIYAFREQLKLAVETGKPVFLHERDAFDDFYSILSEYKDKIIGVVHCFTGTKAQAKKYLELGMYIGFTGWICNDQRNKTGLEALKIIPLNRLMIETDAPFMSPKRGVHTNVPANVKYVAERIALELGKPLEEITKNCYDNTVSFFNLNL